MTFLRVRVRVLQHSAQRAAQGSLFALLALLALHALRVRVALVLRVRVRVAMALVVMRGMFLVAMLRPRTTSVFYALYDDLFFFISVISLFIVFISVISLFIGLNYGYDGTEQAVLNGDAKFGQASQDCCHKCVIVVGDKSKVAYLWVHLVGKA